MSSNLQEYIFPNATLFNDSKLTDALETLRTQTNLELPVLWSENNGQFIVKDLGDIRNILIVGPPSSGKSSLIHQYIISLLYSKHPDNVKFVLIDCKKVELHLYAKIEKLFLAKLPGKKDAIISEPQVAMQTLNALCIEMDNRYDLMKEAGCRNIQEYNKKFVANKLNSEKGHQFLPWIVVIIDELADLTRAYKKEVEFPLERLVGMANSAGIIHIISTNKFVGKTLSSSLISLVLQRVSFPMYDRENYRRFFDTIKVDENLTQGDFVFNDFGRPIKGTTAFFPLKEIELVCEYIGENNSYKNDYFLPEYIDENRTTLDVFNIFESDPLFEDAARIIVDSQMGSTSLVQRRLKLGYNRAGKLMDELESAGIIGAIRGSQSRDVLIQTELELKTHLKLLGYQETIPQNSFTNAGYTPSGLKTTINDLQLNLEENRVPKIIKTDKPNNKWVLLVIIIFLFLYYAC